MTAGYIPRHASATTALEELHVSDNNHLNAHPEGTVIGADFSHLNMILPIFHKNVNFPFRDKHILDQVYTNILGEYKVVPSPHLGLSDRISLETVPSYNPLL